MEKLKEDNLIKMKTEWIIWFGNNLIYCEDTHSFVHRLFDKNKKKKWKSWHDAQYDASEVLKEMMEEFERRER